MPCDFAPPRADFEAGAGIEPANRGFADPDLTTWLPRHEKANGSVGARDLSVNVAANAAIRRWTLGVGRWTFSPFQHGLSLIRTIRKRAQVYSRRRQFSG